MIRLTRCKTAIINFAFLQALQDVLRQLSEPGEGLDYRDQVALAHDWFTTKEAKLEVSRLLKRFQLDESAIEARAIRNTVDDLGRLDFMLTSLANRRDKALHRIAEYREDFPEHVREGADRIIDAERNDGASTLALQRPRRVRRESAA